MSNITRVLNNSCSSTTFSCVKSIHVLAKRTSQLDLNKNVVEDNVQSASMSQISLSPTAFVVRRPGNFCYHPERLKQIIKEKDAQIMCSYLSKQGTKKRKRYMAILDKKKKLLQASYLGQYTLRNLNTLVHKPNVPESYTSYIHSLTPKMKRRNEKMTRNSDHKIREPEHLPKRHSSETAQSQNQFEKKENFINVGKKDTPTPLSAGSSGEEKVQKKKKKKLKPIKTFKRSKYLSKSCEMNMPVDVFEPENIRWMDYPKLVEKTKAECVDVDKVFEKSKQGFKIHVDKNINTDITFPKDCDEEHYLINNVLTLFNRVKTGSERLRYKDSDQKNKISFIREAIKPKPLTLDDSGTYKVVNNTLKRRDMHLRSQYGEMNLSIHTQKDEEQFLKNSKSREETNIDTEPLVAQKTRYLIRLPQLTQEGYKILLYAVKDNDPTKMVFSDCVKGFCMYNDCVLSEEGLREGYVVIFDMKGVQLGHLARVSLPALRCFMLYIQEAHPCRLKGIHILNTASWIHHVMRLVVPLVRSDLLNMVQFHKGNVPEGIPLELLPSDYGGQAPSMEELDSQTKALADKYKDWLIETEDWKSDDSKRVKKTTWWGLFNGSNKTSNVELDEKTILKNLQID